MHGRPSFRPIGYNVTHGHEAQVYTATSPLHGTDVGAIKEPLAEESKPLLRRLGGKMGAYRMYADDDAICRWEEIDLEKVPSWTEGIAVNQLRFGSRQPGVLQDRHPAPQRQFVIILSGQLEIGFEDGSKKIFGPGDARLVEDTTGKGHTTIALGNEPCITMTIGLAHQ